MVQGSAWAEDEPGLAGRFGFVAVGRDNLGELGSQYRTGLLFGVHAGLEIGIEDSPWSVGLGWTTLVRGFYFASSSEAVDQTVNITEMSLGFQLRRALPGSFHHLRGTFGGAFSASNVPLPPSDDRRYLGVYGGLGYDRRLLGEWAWGVESRYTNYFDGPANLSFFAIVTAGFGK